MSLQTDLIGVRHLEAADLPALVALCADGEAMAYAGGLPLTLEQTQLMLNAALEAYRAPGFGIFAITRADTGEMVGFGGVSLRSDGSGTADLVHALVPAYRGQGLMAQALYPLIEHLFANYPAVRAIRHTIANPLDAPAMKLMEEIGMTLERREEQTGDHTLHHFVKERRV